MTSQALSSAVDNIVKVAENAELQTVVPVLDTFLTNLQAAKGNQPLIVAQINALGPNLIAAVIAGASNALGGSIGTIKAGLDAAAAKAEAQTAPGTTAGTAG